jgi:hypothetical protein
MNNEIENQKLRASLWEMVIAAGRMLDNWSEGDEAVKKELWGELHSKGAEARELLESLGSKVNAF